MNMQTRIIIPSALILIGIIVSAGYLIKRNIKPETVIDEVSVTWMTPHTGEIYEELLYTGNIEAKKMVSVTPKAAGSLISLTIRIGDTVRKGKVIAQIEPNAARYTYQQALGAFNAAQAIFNKAKSGARSSEIEMAQENVNQVKAMYDTALDQFKRIEKLYEEQIVTMSDYEKSKTQVDVYRAQLNAAQSQLETIKAGSRKEDLAMASAQLDAALAQLKLAELNLNNTTITSPISGVVALIHVEVGQVVGQTVPICTITDIDSVKIKVKIPEKYYAYMNERRKTVRFYTVPVSYPDKKFKASISTISPFISPENRTFSVELYINNRNHLLTAGMFCEVTAVVNHKNEAMLLPLEAIDNDGNVWVLNSDLKSASSRTVVTGIKNNRFVEVISGLELSDQVIIQGNDYINEQSILNVIEEN